MICYMFNCRVNNGQIIVHIQIMHPERPGKIQRGYALFKLGARFARPQRGRITQGTKRLDAMLPGQIQARCPAPELPAVIDAGMKNTKPS